MHLRLQRKRPYDAPGAIVTADGLDELGTQKKGDMWTPEEDACLRAIDAAWVTVRGPMKELSAGAGFGLFDLTTAETTPRG